MTKNILFIVILAAALFLSGCADKSPAAENSPSPQVPGASENPVGDRSSAAVVNEIYKNQVYGFSFKHPAAAAVSTESDGAGEAVIFRDAAADLGFQIYITAFDDPDDKITAERLKTDIPDMIISESSAFTVDGARGIKFMSENEGEKNREIWFVSPKAAGAEDSARWLFQITAPLKSSEFMEKVLESWEW